MKFSISNIAWDPKDDDQVVKLMKKYGISGVEIAPAKISEQPGKYLKKWQDRGVVLTSMQALLFGGPSGNIFANDQERRQIFEYLSKIIQIAGSLSTKKLVFGSPKNRLKGKLSKQEADQIAIKFFREIAQIALENQVQFCIEPNPSYYACDYINTSTEGIDLVKKVGHKGLGLHLDTGGMTLAGENVYEAICAAAGNFSHFHISEKDLAPIGSGEVKHTEASKALKQINYSDWLAIEMRQTETSLKDIETAFDFVTSIYK
ncbi:sugar phosphate isomerase/epimerase family protein [Candidatus Marithrix sp. Canyon 246]|uniref:sugar phosphate isomerase/epimerase family protein n=1 Tax=Candidatus Marithrix sp. Canyon 246 TaxID=1827136 RepID=UPI000849FC4C|nr:sugar phosphate isomerase/epimerase [Candidatus Marithrix sp. Canyon 246]